MFFKTLHSDSKSILLLSWNCSVENHSFLKVWLLLLLHSPAVQKIFIHPSLYLTLTPAKPSNWYFQVWSQTAKCAVSLTEIVKARCFSSCFFSGKLKPSWIPGLTCNDSSHSRNMGSTHTADYLQFQLGWKKSSQMHNWRLGFLSIHKLEFELEWQEEKFTDYNNNNKPQYRNICGPGWKNTIPQNALYSSNLVHKCPFIKYNTIHTFLFQALQTFTFQGWLEVISNKI